MYKDQGDGQGAPTGDAGAGADQGSAENSDVEDVDFEEVK